MESAHQAGVKGTAAAYCARHGLLPRQLAGDKARVEELQQILLRDDQVLLKAENLAQPLDRGGSVAVSKKWDDRGLLGPAGAGPFPG